MAQEVRLHPNVSDFLDSLSDKERSRCTEALGNLKSSPFVPKSGADIKKLKGKLHDLYRLRVGDYRFEYFVEENIVWVILGFAQDMLHNIMQILYSELRSHVA